MKPLHTYKFQVTPGEFQEMTCEDLRKHVGGLFTVTVTVSAPDEGTARRAVARFDGVRSEEIPERIIFRGRRMRGG